MAEKGEKINEDEVDLASIARIVWAKKRFITKITSLFLVAGLVVALTSKVEFKAACKLMPESQEGLSPDLGGLGGLAGLAGIDLGMGAAGALTPELYPEIVNSVSFTNELISEPVYFESIDTTLTSFYYFSEIDKPSLLERIGEYTFGLPFKIKKLFAGESEQLENYGLMRFSEEDWEVIEEYSERLNISVDTRTGVLNISAEMPDAVASAKTALLLVELLTKNVTQYKIEKAEINKDFIEERFDEAEKDYEEKQRVLARFTDRNRNITTSIVQTEYDRLQNDMDIAFEVFKGLATQLEQAKIKVKEETPVFTVLEPVRIPEEKSKPKRAIIVLVSILLGLTTSISATVLRNSKAIFSDSQVNKS